MAWLPATYRADVAARLRSYGIPGTVETSRSAPVPPEEMPLLAVYTEQQDLSSGTSPGSEPRFDARTHITVECYVQGSPLAQCEEALDLYVGWVTDGLLGDPDWVKQWSRVASVTVTTGIKGEGSAYSGLARIAFVVETVESFPPRGGVPLTGIDTTIVHGQPPAGPVLVRTDFALPAP